MEMEPEHLLDDYLKLSLFLKTIIASAKVIQKTTEIGCFVLK